ncbi:hypothetical protein O6H91_Y563000 [Diphasiastrum complanatum]|nr:hypothetical protein O6H91_Y563000 [Diphasiastrum complanatum]
MPSTLAYFFNQASVLYVLKCLCNCVLITLQNRIVSLFNKFAFDFVFFAIGRVFADFAEYDCEFFAQYWPFIFVSFFNWCFTCVFGGLIHPICFSVQVYLYICLSACESLCFSISLAICLSLCLSMAI